jgi:hypothetical protein
MRKLVTRVTIAVTETSSASNPPSAYRDRQNELIDACTRNNTNCVPANALPEAEPARQTRNHCAQNHIDAVAALRACRATRRKTYKKTQLDKKKTDLDSRV